MSETEARRRAGPRALHVDRDGFVDPAGQHGAAEVAVAAHLLGHGEDLEPDLVRFGL